MIPAKGRLTWPPRGSAGHGYDPVFVPDLTVAGAEKVPNAAGLTFAEIPPEQKNRVSHRADAFEKLTALLPPLGETA